MDASLQVSPSVGYTDYYGLVGNAYDQSDKQGNEGIHASFILVSQSVVMNATKEFNLSAVLGPKRAELYKIIPITIIYFVIFVTGIVGNICTCIVIACNRYMHSATNYYLFNLAIADLFVLLLGLPQETYLFWSGYPWVFGETFCVLRTMAAETTTYASILTITAFTIERYVAICHPMRAQTLSSLTRALKVIVAVWLVSAACSTPMVSQFGLVYVKDANNITLPDSVMCNIRPERYLRFAFEASTFLFFFAPMTVITVLYLLIGVAVRRSSLTRTASDTSNHSGRPGAEARQQQQSRARRAVLKMLVAVVVAFFVCWAPFHTQRLIVIYTRHEDQQSLKLLLSVLYYVSGVLYYVSCVINPILYNIMSLKFRQAFKNTICRPCKHAPRRRRRPQAACVTYTLRFNRKHFALAGDTNASLVHLQVNGHNIKRKRCYFNHHTHTESPLRHSVSKSSGSNSGQARFVNGTLFNECEQALNADKSFHSFQPPRKDSMPLCRPYHSFA